MSQKDTIDKWGIIQLYSAARKKKAWIECISLGYTMLEMGLQYLLKSKAGPDGKPLQGNRIEECRYLIELASLARDEGFLPQAVYDEVQEFNNIRRRAIHKLLTETVTISELKDAAEMVGPIYGKVQDQWFKIKVEPVQHDAAPRDDA